MPQIFFPLVLRKGAQDFRYEETAHGRRGKEGTRRCQTRRKEIGSIKGPYIFFFFFPAFFFALVWLQVGSHSLLLSLLPQDQVIKAKAGKWKQESNQFREAMKAARQATLAEKTGDMSLMPAHVPSGPDPSLVQCPHCFRRFNEVAAERVRG